MTKIIKPLTCVFALAASIALSVGNAHAIQLTLTFVPDESHVLLTGSFSGLPFLSQDVPAPGAPVPGTVDYNPARPSNQTTFQGTITIEVDNLVAPTSIQILSGYADADLSGEWLPEVQPFLDLDGDGNFGEFGADSLPTAGDNPAPPMPGDWGFRIFHPAFGVNLAFAAARDIAYNITMPGPVPVNPLGEFSSSTQNFEFATGWLDYWISPAAGNLRGRAELAGGDDNNGTSLPSTFSIIPLPGNQKMYKLVIPLDIDDPGSDANFFYDGQFVATLIVPEPASFGLFAVAAIAAALASRRRK